MSLDNYYVLKITSDFILLKDLDNGHKTITNSAEEVIKELYKYNKDIYYIDTDGRVDQLCYYEDTFTEFLFCCNSFDEFLAMKQIKILYNSHGYYMSFLEFIKLEVFDRNNYEIEEVFNWIEKYNIELKDKVIWVSENRDIIKSYDGNEDNFLFTYYSNDGTIIKESDDGNEGFLFIFNKGVL